MTALPRIADPAHITDADREVFFANGFAVVDHLVDDATLASIGDAYNEIIDGRTRARGDRHLGGIIRQVKHPSADHSTFRANPAIDAGIRIAEALFQRDGFAKVYEMLIDKPPGTVHETPWHQDVGYTGKPVAPAGTATRQPDIQVWLALDPVDEANGCMHFVPRRYGEPSLRHRVAAGDPADEGRLLAIDEPLDTAVSVACPLPAGGSTIHLVGTPHQTGPNLTERPRRAYIFNIGPAGLDATTEASLRDTWGESALL